MNGSSAERLMRFGLLDVNTARGSPRAVVASDTMSESIKEKIKRLQTAGGGWTKADLASLGVPWPPPKGWRKRLEGK